MDWECRAARIVNVGLLSTSASIRSRPPSRGGRDEDDGISDTRWVRCACALTSLVPSLWESCEMCWVRWHYLRRPGRCLASSGAVGCVRQRPAHRPRSLRSHLFGLGWSSPGAQRVLSCMYRHERTCGEQARTAPELVGGGASDQLLAGPRPSKLAFEPDGLSEVRSLGKMLRGAPVSHLWGLARGPKWRIRLAAPQKEPATSQWVRCCGMQVVTGRCSSNRMPGSGGRSLVAACPYSSAASPNARIHLQIRDAVSLTIFPCLPLITSPLCAVALAPDRASGFSI